MALPLFHTQRNWLRQINISEENSENEYAFLKDTLNCGTSKHLIIKKSKSYIILRLNDVCNTNSA